MEPAPAMLDTLLAQQPRAVSVPGNAAAAAAPRLQASKGLPNNSGSLSASSGALLASQRQASTPLSGAQPRQAVAARTPSLAPAGPAQGALVQVNGLVPAALVPALAAVIDNELLAVLVTTSPATLTPSAPSTPMREILAVPLTVPGAGTIAPSGEDINAVPGMAQALPSDVVPLPTVLTGAENATELPEPGSIALMLLALLLFAWMRQRDARKNCTLT